MPVPPSPGTSENRASQNEGIIVLTADGAFINFIGAPKVSVSAIEAIVQKFNPDAANAIVNIPTTYKNLDLDAETQEFVYAAIIYSADDHQAQISQLTQKVSDYSPVKLLNA